MSVALPANCGYVVNFAPAGVGLGLGLGLVDGPSIMCVEGVVCVKVLLCLTISVALPANCEYVVNFAPELSEIIAEAKYLGSRCRTL